MKRLFISDCEGPISKNDNAYELAANFIPNGDKLFSNISKYDDVLTDVLEKSGYSAGSTLKLILPFFKAYGLTDQQIEEFSAKNILLIANTQATLRHIQEVGDAFIVSTSYEQYIKALCKAVEFPSQNTYCTKLNLDNYPITPQEAEKLKALAQEIAQMPLIEVPSDAVALGDFSQTDQASIKRLDEIFWKEIPQLSVGKLLTEVVTVGGEQKAAAIRDAAERSGVRLADVMYVGDSITDVEALKLVREEGGLAVSFNGNSYAVKNAEIAVNSESNLVLAIIADLFCRLGKTQAMKVYLYWSRAAVEESGTSGALLRQVYKVYPATLPRVEIVNPRNVETIIKESSEFRKQVRGVAIGRLG
ncbi:MAG: HAD hydrolase family protein [Candidatus Bathyarchaeota archaeon]|nr:HAD hydrolase family protein [Candidatus Bathyarchaeota archaeon]